MFLLVSQNLLRKAVTLRNYGKNKTFGTELGGFSNELGFSKHSDISLSFHILKKNKNTKKINQLNLIIFVKTAKIWMMVWT